LIWNKYRSFGNSLDYLRYTRKRNSVRKLTRSLRISNEAKIAQNIRPNPKQFWKYVTSKTKAKSSIPNISAPDGNEATTDFEKATVLNSHFGTVFTKENLSNIPHMYTYPYSKRLSNIHITSNLVCSKLKSLSPSKYLRLLNQTAELLCLPLCLIYRKSLAEGILPFDWKEANVIPVFKKGDQRQPNTYQPISLTSVVCKVFESIVKDSIVSHMMKNNWFSKMHFC